MITCARDKSSPRASITSNAMSEDIHSHLLMLQRSINTEHENQERLEKKMDEAIEALNKVANSQKDMIIDITGVVRQGFQPLEGTIESFLTKAVNNTIQKETVSRNSQRDIGDLLQKHDLLHSRLEDMPLKASAVDEDLDCLFKRHLEPIRSDLTGLRDLAAKATGVGEKKRAADTGQIAQKVSPEDAQLHIDLESLEKIVIKCIHEELTKFLKPAPSDDAFTDDELTLAARTSHSQLQALIGGSEHQSGPSQQHTAISTVVPRKRNSDRPMGPTSTIKQTKIKMHHHGKTSDTDDDHVEIKHISAMSSLFVPDTDMDSKPYHVENLYKDHGICQRIVRDVRFDTVTSIVVFANVVYIGLEADRSNDANVWQADAIWLLSQMFFSTYFTIELLIRYLAFAKSRDTLRDGWFKFDLFLVSTMILDMFLVQPLAIILSEDHVNIPTQALRMMRLLRLLRIGRLMRVFPELVTMVLGLTRALRAIFSTLLLIMFMMYGWAIFIHMLMKDEKEANETLKKQFDFEFSSIGHCLWTLLMDGVLQLDNAALVMTALVWDDRWNFMVSGFAFTLFSLLSSLLILQMLIGLMCDVVATVGREKRRAQVVSLIRERIQKELIQNADEEGKITKDEFDACINSPSSRVVFKHLQINPLFFGELAGLYFQEPDATVPIRALLDVLLLCKGDDAATVDLISIVLCFLNKELVDMENHMTKHIKLVTHHQEALLEHLGASPVEPQHITHEI